MENPEVENYEQLHIDYKKLMSEYEDLKSENVDENILTKKLDEIQKKHKEITDVFSKLAPKS